MWQSFLPCFAWPVYTRQALDMDCEPISYSSLSKLTIQNEGRKTRTLKPPKPPALQDEMDFGLWILSLLLGVCLFICVLRCTHTFTFDKTCLLIVTMIYFLPFHFSIVRENEPNVSPLHGNRLIHKGSYSLKAEHWDALFRAWLGSSRDSGTEATGHCVAGSKEPEFWWGILFLVRRQRQKIFLITCGLW